MKRTAVAFFLPPTTTTTTQTGLLLLLTNRGEKEHGAETIRNAAIKAVKKMTGKISEQKSGIKSDGKRGSAIK
jgi:hypothetical protein